MANEPPTGIPSAQEVDAAWLCERLRESGLPEADLVSFTEQPIGTGQLGKCIRYSLQLAGDAAGAPRSLVGKFPSDDPTSRQTGVDLRNYLKEVRFYRELQPRLAISTPRCYYAAIEGEGPEFALLLEDMAPAEPGNQIEGCDPQTARAAVLELVGLHAPSWCDDSLRGIDWIGEPTAETTAHNRELYRDLVVDFLDRYGHRLETDSRAIIEKVGRSGGLPFVGLRRPFSLVHVDYRLDNLLIDRRTAPPKITCVDWQSITLGSPLSDVAYFLGAGLRSADRRKHEESIVRDYHRALEASGIDGYSWDRCWDDYRRGTFAGFGVTVIASMLVAETERGNEMFATMARRHTRHAIDLRAEELLDR